MRKTFLSLLALTAGCATATSSAWTGRDVRAAEDTPIAFVTEDGEQPVQACRNPLIDPRDQTRIRLVRSGQVGGMQRGDYEVPQGRYGVGARELLRVNCETGEVVGIVAN